MAIELILLRQWASYLALPVWLVSETGDLVFYNEAAEVLLGRSFDDSGTIAGSDIAELFVTQDDDGTPLANDELPIVIALSQNRPAHRSLRFRALDGVWRRIEVTAFPVTGQGNRHLGAVAMFWESAAE